MAHVLMGNFIQGLSTNFSRRAFPGRVSFRNPVAALHTAQEPRTWLQQRGSCHHALGALVGLAASSIFATLQTAWTHLAWVQGLAPSCAPSPMQQGRDDVGSGEMHSKRSGAKRQELTPPAISQQLLTPPCRCSSPRCARRILICRLSRLKTRSRWKISTRCSAPCLRYRD